MPIAQIANKLPGRVVKRRNRVRLAREHEKVWMDVAGFPTNQDAAAEISAMVRLHRSGADHSPPVWTFRPRPLRGQIGEAPALQRRVPRARVATLATRKIGGPAWTYTRIVNGAPPPHNFLPPGRANVKQPCCHSPVWTRFRVTRPRRPLIPRALAQRRTRLPAPDADRQDRGRQRQVAHHRFGGMKLAHQSEQPQRGEERRHHHHPRTHGPSLRSRRKSLPTRAPGRRCIAVNIVARVAWRCFRSTRKACLHRNNYDRIVLFPVIELSRSGLVVATDCAQALAHEGKA